jgi:filamentous hemagglutinin
VDVFGPNGEYIAVGGPGKAWNMSKLGEQMKILKYGADRDEVRALAYFEEGTPQEVLDLAKKWLGDGNVFPFPK